MQQYHFHRDQLHDDLTSVTESFWKFLKSFGPSQKKIVDRPIGIFEELHIRFRLSLVEMGISKVIRMVIALIVGIFLYFVVFRHADPAFKIILVFVYISYYIWLMVPHLVKDGKFEFKAGKIEGTPLDTSSGYMILFHNKRVEAQDSISATLKRMVTRKSE